MPVHGLLRLGAKLKPTSNFLQLELRDGATKKVLMKKVQNYKLVRCRDLGL